MALERKWVILYYGFLASFTGGWLPIRNRRPLLAVFHIVLFLTFIFVPVIVFFVNPSFWVGWFVYSFIVMFLFVVLKIVNFRIHQSLGSDPVPDPPKEAEEEEEGEDNDGATEEKGEKKSDKAADDMDLEESTIRRHQSSVSTLGHTSSFQSTDGARDLELVETGSSSRPVASALLSEGVKDKDVKSPVDSSAPQEALDSPDERSRLVLRPPEAEILGLMSPVHRSNSNMDTSGSLLAAGALAAEQNSTHQLHYHRSYNCRPEDTGGLDSQSMQRSNSMPPSMFEVDGAVFLASERGTAPGHGQGSYRGHLRQRMLESQSEDELTTSGGREGDVEDSGEALEEGSGAEEGRVRILDGSYPRGRRNAFRGGTRLVRRATCAADGSIASAATVARHNAAATLEEETRTGTPILLVPALSSSSGRIPIISEADESPILVEPAAEPSLEQRAQSRLLEEGHYFLEDLTDKFSPEILQAIVDRKISPIWFAQMGERVGELKRGHLGNGEDHSPGAIHWIDGEGEGEYDFYMFQPEEDDVLPDPRIIDDLTLRFFMDSYQSEAPPVPPRSVGTQSAAPPAEEEPLPVYRVIPFVRKTEIPLNIQRKALEEYMDRNVTMTEMVLTIVLAVVVCVVAALLLSLVDFYRGFWAFWFCYVVATAHFSLIKSVQDDPASPSPGQNHIMAVGRALYFIVCGVTALCIHAALTHIGTDSFTPLCVYGFNINSPAVLLFVRDGLLIFILFFPILFLLGWLPQADTFSIYFLEQVDMHVFGGTASTGLVCSLYSIGRSIASAVVLWALGYTAFRYLKDGDRLTCTSRDLSPDNPMGCGDVYKDRVALSFYVGAIFAVSYVLSRSTSNHQYIWDLVQRGCLWWKRVCFKRPAPETATDEDPLEEMYCRTLRRRMLSDVVISVLVFFVITSLSLTTGFCRNPIPAYVVYCVTVAVGAFNHYLLPHIRKEMPWLCCSQPIVRAREWDVFEVTVEPKMSPVEKVLQWLLFLEKNVLYPLCFLFAFNLSAHHYQARFGDFGAAAALTVAGMKVLRTVWTDTPHQYIILALTLLFFNFDYAHLSEGLPLNYFIAAILFSKFYDLYLKILFIYIYIAPWQSSWSSAGHIFIQPLLIPHTPLIFLQTLISSIMNAPINPVYASTLFVLSYVRPIKYWEKNYNTKRADSSNTRLETQLEGSLRNPNPDRLDSLFYEHLTWVLQKDLCGDLVLGRWGRVASGDFFILTSDRLNALVHIIEYGNGFVTFQLRGLEFRGTYCHQREVEAITESIADDDGCCCAEPGHIPCVLSCNKIFGSRWLAWEVVSSSYTLHGYSISENQAHLVFNTFDYRRGYITYLIECIIYKLVRWPRLRAALENENFQALLREQGEASYVDTDPLFDESKNCDYSHRHNGILKEVFVQKFQPYLAACCMLEGVDVDTSPQSFCVTLCFAYTILGRRLFYQHAQQGAGRRNGDNFMNGLYRMFLGDARPNHPNDMWVFQEVDSIKDVIIPATRIALKVHQDNFSFSEEYTSPQGIYQAVKEVDENHIVTHENDHEWRTAVVTNKPSLLALRYQRTEDSYIYPYKLIRLTSKFIKFRVIKLNRECVRSLWTSQQHELIFLRNSDSERGSIQNHKPTLRNMVNSSMDLPIGYPIYVSPLQTSFVDRHASWNDSVLAKITDPVGILKRVWSLKSLCKKCKSCAAKIGRGGSRSRSSSKRGNARLSTSNEPPQAIVGHRRSSVDSLTGIQYDPSKSYDDPFPDSDSEEQLWKPMWVSKRVSLTNSAEIFDSFKMNWLKWRPEDQPRAEKAMKSHWKNWRPQEGMEGEVVHEWRPFHIDPVQRSHIDKVILLVRMEEEDFYILVREQGVKEM